MRKSVFRRNGEKGGRPKGCSYVTSFVIPEFNTVILTETQYNSLIDKYGNILIEKAMSILENWLLTSSIGSKFKDKNHYAYFRADGWVINEAKSSIQQT